MYKSDLLKTAAALLMLAGTSMSPQVISTGPTGIGLSGDVQESLTISLDQSVIYFSLNPGNATNAGSSGINVTTTWNLASGRSAVALYAYFDNASSALVNGINNLPSAVVSASVGGSSVGNFTNTVPFGTGVTLMTQPITGSNLSGTKISAVALNIDLSALPNLPAGTYSGTLHFQAQATP